MEQIVVVGADPVLDLVRAAPFAFQWEFALNVYRDNGGWGGIRTHETVSRLPVFKTGAFNRSATHPAPPA